jgi:nucleotide-binding universal stress UspA family protein
MVTLDGSKAAEESIPAAIALSQKLGAEIYLVQVCEIFALLKKDRDAEEIVLKKKSTEYLKCVRCRMNGSGIAPSTVVLTGKPADEICEHAGKSQIDLIVMTSHGLGGFTGWAIGSVSEKVVKHAKIPVLLVRSKNPDRSE